MTRQSFLQGGIFGFALFGLPVIATKPGLLAADPRADEPAALRVGERIAFTSWEKDKTGLRILNVQSQGLDVIDTSLDCASPRWSWNGKFIAGTRTAPRAHLVVIELESLNVRQLKQADEVGSVVSWSPQGTMLIFDQLENADQKQKWVGSRVRSIAISGEDDRQLLDVEGSSPDCSRVSSEIVFSRAGGLAVMALDGSNVKPLVRGNAEYLHPRWSPTGRRIVFAKSERSGNVSRTAICVIDSDGRNEVLLTDLPGQCVCPSWSPDGTRLVFHHVPGRQPEKEGTVVSQLFLMRADGTGLRQLVECGSGYAPDFCPVILAE